MVDSSGGDQPRADSGRDDPEKEKLQDDHLQVDLAAESRQQAHTLAPFTGGVGMLRFAGAGMELGGSAIICAGLGYALDRYLENTTLIATALGAVVGFAAGLYRFIRMAMAANPTSGHR